MEVLHLLLDSQHSDQQRGSVFVLASAVKEGKNVSGNAGTVFENESNERRAFEMQMKRFLMRYKSNCIPLQRCLLPCRNKSCLSIFRPPAYAFPSCTLGQALNLI